MTRDDEIQVWALPGYEETIIIDHLPAQRITMRWVDPVAETERIARQVEAVFADPIWAFNLLARFEAFVYEDLGRWENEGGCTVTRCNRGVVLGHVARWCHLDAGHRGAHVCYWREKPFPFPEPPPRYGADGVRVSESNLTRESRGAAG